MLLHFYFSLMGICFDPCDQDLMHYDKSLFTHRKSNRWMLITNDKSLQSFGQKGRVVSQSKCRNWSDMKMLNSNIFPHINPVNLIQPSLFFCLFLLLSASWNLNIASPVSPQQHTVLVHYLTSWPPDYRRLPCHALFRIACVTETDAPFTAAYLNMTPNNVNNSAICQFVCNIRKNGGKENDIQPFSLNLVWLRLWKYTIVSFWIQY